MLFFLFLFFENSTGRQQVSVDRNEVDEGTKLKAEKPVDTVIIVQIKWDEFVVMGMKKMN